MSFVNGSLLMLGAFLVAVPIVLHLAMRQKPKHQMFPALRFVRQQRQSNQRRLRLRQLLLLLLRCLAILLLALALAQPSVSSAQLGNWLVLGGLGLLLAVVGWLTFAAAIARRGWMAVSALGLLSLLLVAGLVNTALALATQKAPMLLGDREAAVAAALVIDTSPRMTLRYENQTRLERAQEIANWLLRQLPADSQVAVIDSSRGVASFAVDLGAAASAIGALDTTFAPQPWSRLLEDAVRLLDSSDRSRKELYVFTDRSLQTWDDLKTGAVVKLLEASADTMVQVVDVSVDDPRNDGIVALDLSQQSLTPGSPLELRARIARTGPEGERALELYLEPPNAPDPILVNGVARTPDVTLRARQQIRLPKNDLAAATFQLPSLPYGTQHGYIQLQGTDALTLDDRRYFTVHVRAPWQVLIVAGEGTEPFYVSGPLAPLPFQESGRAKFQCKVISVDRLADQKLNDYAAVGLLDPPPLDDAAWNALAKFVRRGGGLAMALGRNVGSARAFNSQAAQELLPAPVVRQWRDPDGLVFAPREFDHPMLAAFADIRTTIPWDAMPIDRHWVMDAWHENTREILPLSNNKPAALERFVGQGRVVLFTTPISDPDLPDRPPWNAVVPTGEQSWPFLVMVDRLFLYLVQSRDASLNYVVGQPAALPLAGTTVERVDLFTPRGSWQEFTAQQGQIDVPFTDIPGSYRMRSDASATLPRGFSVNLDRDATQLDRLSREQLAELLGRPDVPIAATEQEIVREIDQARIGKEFYPFLLPLLVIVLAAEYVIANRFYADSRVE